MTAFAEHTWEVDIRVDGQPLTSVYGTAGRDKPEAKIAERIVGTFGDFPYNDAKALERAIAIVLHRSADNSITP